MTDAVHLAGLDMQTASITSGTDEIKSKLMTGLPLEDARWRQFRTTINGRADFDDLDAAEIADLIVSEDEIGDKNQTSGLAMVVCSHCGNKGHIKRDCKRLKEIQAGKAIGQRDAITCKNCGKKGHTKTDCWAAGGGKAGH